MTDELVTLATRARTHAVSELFRVLHKLDTGGFMIRAEGVRQAGDLAELVARLEAIVTPPAYDPDQDETPNQGRGEDLDRTEGDDAPELAADAGTQSEPACGVDGPVGQDHGGAAGEPEPTTEGAGASDPPHAALDFIVGAKHDRRADGSTRIGFEDHRNFPVGKWTRLYVPTARIDECIAALDAIGSGAHAPDTVDDTTTELDTDTVWSYRMVNRGQYALTRDGSDVAEILFHERIPGTAAVVPTAAQALAKANHGRFVDPRNTPRSQR